MRRTGRRSTGPDATTRNTVYGRDGMRCCICGGTYPLTLQHRRARGMGGTHRPETNSPAALVVLCGSGTTGCHGFIEANPTIAKERGYRVPQHANPADVPVLRFGGWWWLCDDGTAVPVGGCDPSREACTDSTPCLACPKRGAA